tara:strand:- start:201 stop:2090 length:1890 start_codon:yes stop_codon:yes gene_type:complete
MTYNDRKTEVNSLDFFGIKNNLKNYLSGLDQFTDFNFEGSGANILLDLLAYVTHYQGFYNNMVANEMFLDSAVKRTSVVSHAKALGYTPSSSSPSTATVDITINDTDSSITYLSKRTKFKATKDNITYTFTNPSSEEFEVLNSTQKIARNVTLVEGSWRLASFVVDSNVGNQRFIIPNKNVDMSRITVNVQKSTTDDSGWSDTWTEVTDVTELSSTSKVYFTQETEDGFYEIYFGDGILGKKLDDGNLIVVDFLITNGAASNEIGSQDSVSSRSFTSSNISNLSDIVVVTTSNGGSGKETLDSIRFNAPKAYQTQNRNVTANDYKSYISQNYGNASDVFVWGGEDNDPPEYGKVFVSVKPSNSSVLNNEEKISLQNLIKDQNMVSIIPDVVDPNYIYLNIKSKVKFNPDETTLSASDMKTQVLSSIVDYKLLSLEKFDRNFRHSKFTKSIDDTDDSILGNDTSIKIEKRLTPTIGEFKSYTLRFENPLYHPHDGHMSILSSSLFTYTKDNGVTVNAFLDDDGKGTVRIYELVGDTREYIKEDIGTIDYTKGIVSLKNFKPDSVENTIIRVFCEPQDNDVLSERNTILVIDTENSDAIDITVESYIPYSTKATSSSVSVSSNDSSSNSGY